jgi:putative hydrolase
MLIETDMHTHTVASTHAYSTVVELAQFAQFKGLKAIAITDHGPGLPDGAHPWHFGNMRCLPPYIQGVRVLHGAEVNIMDFDGTIDLPLQYQKQLDWIIASFHDPCLAPAGIKEHTQAYLKLAENPYIDVIGHSGTDNYKYDYEKVLPVFKEKKILVEINSHSFEARAGSLKNCMEIALLCKQYEIPIVVNSDAHVCFSVGDVEAAFKLLDEIEFPYELIVNLTLERLSAWIKAKKNKDII